MTETLESLRAERDDYKRTAWELNSDCTKYRAVIQELLNQLETNQAQAIAAGHHWPNERVNMTSAAKLQARKALSKAEETTP